MSSSIDPLTPHADFTLQCDNLKIAGDCYIRDLGFRLDTIYPADKPRVMILTGHGIRIRLEQTIYKHSMQTRLSTSYIVQRCNAQAWGDGRAGMQYRDLIPGRMGGAYIASHIRISKGGPVTDYVHHHHVRFQLIYCVSGWVRLVYEDQGPPFIMRAGDCILQPPHILHRVIESSDAMEVIEVASPAEHETLVEHDIELPTNRRLPGRKFAGQVFLFHQACSAAWQRATLRGFLARDTGIGNANCGIASAQVMRANGDCNSAEISSDSDLCFNFILNGSASVSGAPGRGHLLQARDAFTIANGQSARLTRISADFEFLHVNAK